MGGKPAFKTVQNDGHNPTRRDTMTRQFLWRACIAALALCAAVIASAQTEELVRTIPMEAGGQFTLSNISGDITIAGADDNALTLRVTKRLVDPEGVSEAMARDWLDRVEIEIRERGGRVAVEAEYLRRGLARRLADFIRGGRAAVAVDYDVTVPRGIAVAIESISGSVTVEGVDGETSIETVSGDVRLASLPQLTEVEMVSGDLRMTDVGSDDELSAEAVSGRITIDGVRAPRLDVSTVSGTLALTRVEARRVDVETVSGPVTFDGALDADGRYEFESHSGSIRVRVPAGTGFDLEAQSFSGALELNAPITVTVNQGNRTVELTTGRTITTFSTRGPEQRDRLQTATGAVTVDWLFNREGRTGNREIDGTVGDGGGRLDLSTFSGDMAIVVGGDR